VVDQLGSSFFGSLPRRTVSNARKKVGRAGTETGAAAMVHWCMPPFQIRHGVQPWLNSILISPSRPAASLHYARVDQWNLAVWPVCTSYLVYD
jgi:hypothetical protein